MVLRVASAYRTVSTKAVLVVAGIIPIYLLMEDGRRLFARADGHREETKKEERETTLQKWQREWEANMEVRLWIKRLVPDITGWVECKHRRTDYFVTQALTGHGSFRKYMKRIGKSPDDICIYFGEEDTPEHTVFQCPRWAKARREAEAVVGEMFSADNIVEYMITTKANCEVVGKMFKKIMSEKEREERRLAR